MQLKLTSDRWWPERQVQSGFLWHYGHFIHDFLMPLNDLFIAQGTDPSGYTFYLQNTADQSVGPFASIVEAFFDATICEVSPQQFEALGHEHLVVNAYLFGPYHAHTLDNMVATARRRFDLRGAESGPDVILIERGASKHGFEDREDIAPNARASGRDRRRIDNHHDVARHLEARYGTRVQTLVLEHLTFAEQVQHFWRARLVIGQHGAGLNNILWMRDLRGGVVEIGHRTVPTFVHLTTAKGYFYASVGPEDRGRIEVCLDALDRALDMYEAAWDSIGPR